MKTAETFACDKAILDGLSTARLLNELFTGKKNFAQVSSELYDNEAMKSLSTSN